MDPQRQQVLANFVAKQLGTTAKALRPLAILGAVVGGGGLVLTAALLLGGAADFDEIGVLLGVFGVVTVGSVFGTVRIAQRLRSMPNHPLVVAIRSQPSDVARVVPTDIRGGAAGHRTALKFVLRSGDENLVMMDEKARAEFTAWLAREGAQVG